jgi:hypothetical protein
VPELVLIKAIRAGFIDKNSLQSRFAAAFASVHAVSPLELSFPASAFDDVAVYGVSQLRVSKRPMR